MAGTVVRFRTTDRNPLTEHEAATQTAVALMLAELTDCDFGGIWDPTFQYRGRVFFVPEEALVVDEAAQLGIASPDDLFGGVVPYRFAKTKAVTHALVAPDATRPPGWCDAFTAAVAPAVLPGFTAFTREDAREAASRLLTTGEARIKKTLASGSRGQRVTKTLDAVDAVLETIADDELAECGVVIETNLHDVTTSSVGQVCVDGYASSYVGIQRE